MDKLISDTIKFSVMFMCMHFLYAHLLRIRLGKSFLLYSPLWIVLSAALYFAVGDMRFLMPFVFLILSFLYLLAVFRKPLKISVPYCFISVGIDYFVLTASYVVSLPLSFAFSYVGNETVSLISMTVIVSVIQTVATNFIFRIKRFKNGLYVPTNDSMFILLILISAITIFVASLFYSEIFKSNFVLVILFSSSAIGAICLILWNAVLSDRYKVEVFKRNMAIYEKTLNEYETRNKNLLDNNDALSAIIHRDNKFISVMEIAVGEVLQGKCDQQSVAELGATLKKLSDQRKLILDDYADKKTSLPKTGMISTDSTLIYINSVAEKHDMEAEIIVSENFSSVIRQTSIDMTHFNTLLCDMCENAIHAAENAEVKKIKLELTTHDGCPEITVSDSGAPFDEKVLKSLGRLKITTRTSSGGSGIGLMYIFEILQKYGASFYLDETYDKNGFAKSITVRFDSRAALGIKSERPNVVKAFKNRTTIYD